MEIDNPDNTGLYGWRCKKCGGHDANTVSIPDGIDFSSQSCEGCGLERTAHNANGCMAWCCCVCPACTKGREKSNARIEADLAKEKVRGIQGSAGVEYRDGKSAVESLRSRREQRRKEKSD